MVSYISADVFSSSTLWESLYDILQFTNIPTGISASFQVLSSTETSYIFGFILSTFKQCNFVYFFLWVFTSYWDLPPVIDVLPKWIQQNDNDQFQTLETHWVVHREIVKPHLAQFCPAIYPWNHMVLPLSFCDEWVTTVHPMPLSQGFLQPQHILLIWLFLGKLRNGLIWASGVAVCHQLKALWEGQLSFTCNIYTVYLTQHW